MNIVDIDLQSIQEVRNLIEKAKQAQKILGEKSQEEVDNMVRVMTEFANRNSALLGKLAFEETGFGRAEDKKLKNTFASKVVYESIKDIKTIGILKDDKVNKVMEVAVPVGVIAGLIPSTNPTSTTIFKALVSIKSGNSIVFSPHPNAKKCILETVKILKEALRSIGEDDEVIQCITLPSLEGTQELLRHRDTSLILATGGEAMVKAAYSSGTPALGVGPGNGPAFIERSADIPLAVKRIMDSKTFDNGVICASEQSIVVEECIKDEVLIELKNQGAYFLSQSESDKLGKFIMRSNGTMNPLIVGKTIEALAALAELDIPKDVKVLISMQDTVGKNNPYSREKLAPILAFYVEKNWEKACERCIELLNNEGKGHTLIIHSENPRIIKEFALKKPVSRILVNTPGALGGIGATTNLTPSLTLGCGAVGGSATSDNVGPMNLLNIRRVAYGVRELEDIRNDDKSNKGGCDISEKDIDQIVKRVIALINN